MSKHPRNKQLSIIVCKNCGIAREETCFRRDSRISGGRALTCLNCPGGLGSSARTIAHLTGSIPTQLKELLDKLSFEGFEILGTIARDVNMNPSARIAAVKEINDRTFGKAVIRNEIKGDLGSGANAIVILPAIRDDDDEQEQRYLEEDTAINIDAMDNNILND